MTPQESAARAASHTLTNPEIFLGYSVGGVSTPISLARSVLAEGHVHIRGRTRSGKTSRAILPLAVRLMSEYTDARGTHKDPICIFDLGGDQALFHFVKEAAGQMERRFRFLSLDARDDWDFFDPFQAVPPGERDVMRLATLLIEAFNLDNGLIYGGQYFTQQNLAALLDVVRKLSKEEGRRLTLDDVSNYLERQAVRKKVRDADQIRMTFNFLLEYPQLRAPENTDPNRCIDMARVLEDGEVLYFFTPTLNETTTARQIAGLGLYNLLNAAIQRSRKGQPLRRTWIFIDEFHELAGRAFEALLAQSGKFGVSLIMANQTTSQLENRDSALHQVVFDNTHVKMYFTVTCLRDIEDLQALSEEEIVMLPGRNQRGLSGAETEKPTLLPKWHKNKILDVSETAGHCFLVLNEGKGHREPQRIEARFLIDDPARYEVARTTPLPRRPDPDTIRDTTDSAARRSAIKHELKRKFEPQRRQKMLAVLASKRQAEAIEVKSA